MPIICIGPVCVPWTALLPIICVIMRPIYNLMPPSVQEKLDVLYEWIFKFIDSVTPSFLKKKKTTARKSSTAAGGKILSQGEMVILERECDFFATTSSVEVMVYFTAKWCKPCQQIKPAVANVAASTSLRVISIDVDDFPELQEECSVTAMPTFLLFANGKEMSRSTGAVESNLESMTTRFKKQQ